MNRVLLRRLLKLARQAAANEAGQTANKRARNRYWRNAVDECEEFPGVTSRRQACLMAADLLGVNHNTLRGIAGPSPPWMKIPR